MSHDPVVQRFKFKTISLNSANADLVSLTGLPTRLRVARLMVHNVSTSLAASLATVGLRDAAAGAGNVIVTAATLTTLTGATKNVDMTLALTDVITTGGLYVRSVVAHGSAATADVLLEFFDLT